ncbi:MAG: ComF family protein [Clostridia bacterium]|nr:ComF family protein [Clostridia bacterium]
MRRFSDKARHSALNLLSPGPYYCFGCGNEAELDEQGLCEECAAKLKYCPSPTWLPPLDGLSIGVQYTEPIKAAVLRLKMGRDYACTPFLAQYMHIPSEWNADLLVPVPMHPIHAFLRGFNQSVLLAEYVSAQTGIPYTRELLYKTKYTQQQKRLSGDARRKNIRGSFYAEPACKGLRLILIDDVFTTGATVYECAKVLKKAGALDVYACCVATPSD